MDASPTIAPAEGARPWLTELRATMALAWPLILANVTQQAIQATDVLLMGRLGPTQLAAATLALNLTFTFNLFMLGLLTASSPMMATALGQRSNAVRDVRRTFRAGHQVPRRQGLVRAGRYAAGRSSHRDACGGTPGHRQDEFQEMRGHPLHTGTNAC